MANGAVRELITSVKFKLDTASVNNVNRAIDKIIHKLRHLEHTVGTVHFGVSGTSHALHAIQSVQSAVNHLNHSSANVHIQAATSHINNALHHGQNQQTQHQNTTSRLQNFADAGGEMAGMGAGMLAGVALPVKTAVDFEAAMARVKAVTNSTDADMQRLENTAKQLGATTPHSAMQVAQAMNYLGMAGWNTEQIIAGLPAVLNLATASGEDLGRVSDIVSDDLTAFHMQAGQAGHMADVMAAAATSANTNVAMMGDTFKYAGAVAGTLGYSVEDVATATALMANAGIKGEQAGTSLRSVMTRLISPPAEAAKALDQLGFSATNADGTVKPFIQQIKELRASMSGLTDAQKSEMGTSIAGLEALSGFMTLVNSSDAELAKMEGAINNADGAAQKMADTMHNTSKGALQDFSSALEGLMIAAGDTLLPVLTELAKGLTVVVRAFGEFASAHPQVVAGLMAVAGVIGTLLVSLGTLGMLIGGVMTGFTALFGEAGLFGGAMASLGTLLSSIWAVILPVIEAVGAAIAGLSAGAIAAILAIIAVIVLIIAYWDEFKAVVISVVSAIVETVRAACSAIVGAFGAAIDAVKGAFSDLGSHAMGIINQIVDSLGSWLGDKIAWARDALSGLQSFASSVMDGISFGGGSSTSQEQNNVYNLNNSTELAAAQAGSNSWFW